MLGIVGQSLWADPATWFWLQFLLACLAPPLLWFIAYRISIESNQAYAALCAGLLGALFPAHVLFSASVIEHISVSTFCLGAVAAWLGCRTSKYSFLCILAGLLAGFAVHIRPEMIPFTGVLALLFITGPKQGRRIRILGAIICLALILWRLLEIESKEMATANRVLFSKQDFSPWVLIRLCIHSIWQEPGVRSIYNAMANIFTTPLLVWPLFLYGSAKLIRERNWHIPLLWGMLFFPICLRGSPFSDAIRMQLPSLMLACSIFAVGAVHFTQQKILWKPYLLPILALNTIPLLLSASQPWMANQYLETLRKGARIAPKDAWFVVPHFNSYAKKEITLADSFRDSSKRRTRTLREEDPIPEGEVWLWWPVQCTKGLVPTKIMGPTNAKACLRFKNCTRESIIEKTITGRADTGWNIPTDGIQVGWYKLQNCKQ